MAKAEPQPVARLWLTGEAMAQGQGYTLKSIGPVALGSHVQGRLFTPAPGETIPGISTGKLPTSQRVSVKFITFACTSMQTVPAR